MWGAASNGESVVHLVDADCGRWAVGRLPADAVGWAIAWGVAATDGWIADCQSAVDVREGATDGWTDIRETFVAGGKLVGRLAGADAEGGVGGLDVDIGGGVLLGEQLLLMDNLGDNWFSQSP